MSKKVTKADLEVRVGALEKDNDRLRTAAISADATVKAAIKNSDAMANSIADLKTELMARSLEVARLEGYITRANESDPAPVAPVHRTFGRIEQPSSSCVNSYGSTWSEPQTTWWNR